MSLPLHAFVPALDAQYDDLGLSPYPYQVVGSSETPEGAVYLQVFTGSGYLWVSPGEYTAVPSAAEVVAAVAFGNAIAAAGEAFLAEFGSAA